MNEAEQEVRRRRARNNRSRGMSFEREIVNQAKEYGLDAVRSWGSDGRSRGLIEQVDVLLENKLFIQCKRKKTLPAYLLPDDKVYGQVFRADRQEPYIMLRFSTFLSLLKTLKKYGTDDTGDGANTEDPRPQ